MMAYTFPSVKRDGITLIVGLGETGVAAAKWCARHGARLRVLDTRTQPAGLAGLRAVVDDDVLELRLGAEALSPDALEGVHTLVLSPGLSPIDPAVRALLDAAHAAGLEVVGEIELFARALNDMRDQGYVPKVLAVTGTNGKTTVTAMARQLAQASGFSAVAAGNISPAALGALATALDDNALPDVWVIELSSFQLTTTRSLHAAAAVVLNISPDHLDWHGSLDAYVQAKSGVLSQAMVKIVNRDDAIVRGMVNGLADIDVRSFGSDAPSFAGDLGLEVHHEMAWVCAATDRALADASRAVSSRKGAPSLSERAAGERRRLMPADALRVRGTHNVLNAQAALALVSALDAGWAPMLHALHDYRGEPHRMEFVRTIAGVDFINDSKGTNVGATVAALYGLDRPLVLIAGGLAKGQDFSALARAAAGRVRCAVLMGRDAPELAGALSGAGVACDVAGAMPEAVGKAFEAAQPGDVVLLSPACASMDMFDSYVHRGRCFVDAVSELALDQGEVA